MRSGLRSALRLRGLLLSQAPAAAGGALSVLGAAPSSSASSAAIAASAAAAAGRRPFSYSSAAAEAAAPQQQQQPDESTAAAYQDGNARGRRYAPVDPDTPLGRLVHCTSIAEMRAWRQELLVAAGAFGAPELGAAIRALCQREGVDRSERQAYLRELLEVATAPGAPPLDGKAAAYLVWGPAKIGLPASEPAVAAAAEAALRHVDGMQSNDLSSCLWALGVLGAPPSEAQQAQLLSRLHDLVPEMRVKELTAAATGATRLHLPPAFCDALVSALEAKLEDGEDFHSWELSRLVKLLPHLGPGAAPDSALARGFFGMVIRKANRMQLAGLAETLHAASRLGFQFEEGELKRLLGCAQSKLSENRGFQVQTLLYALTGLGLRTGDGPVTQQFVEKAVAAQVEAVCKGRGTGAPHVVKFINTLTVLEAGPLPDECMQRMLAELTAAGLEHVQKPWRVQMAFKRLKYKPGVQALEPFTGHGERVRERLQQQEQQQAQQQVEPAQQE